MAARNIHNEAHNNR